MVRKRAAVLLLQSEYDIGGTYPFRVGILVLLIGARQILAVEATDRQRKREAHDVDDGEEDVAQRKTDATHGDG